MIISKAIARAKALTGNVVEDSELLRWLSELDGRFMLEFFKGSGWATYDAETDGNSDLLIPYPWDDLYIHYLAAMIYLTNGEYDRYSNSMEVFNKKELDYRKWYARNNVPVCIDAIKQRTETVVTEGNASHTFWYLSAYAIAVKHGYTGTEAEWLEDIENYNREYMEAAQAAQAAAESARDSSAQHEAKSLEYKQAAGVSAGNASDSEAAAKLSADNAALSEANAAESAAEAKEASTAAQVSETNAKNSETAAHNSEEAANASALIAESAKESAVSSAASASNAAGYANQKAAEAGAAADAATAHAADAKSFKNGARGAESSAWGASNQAYLYAADAGRSASNASGSETNAARSATNAATSEHNASLSETNAAESERQAGLSKNAAAQSAQNAGQSEFAAQGYAEDAEAAATDIQDSIDGVAQEPTAQVISQKLDAILTAIEDSSGSAESLNGFGLELDDTDNSVDLTYSDVETGEEITRAKFPTDTTAVQIALALQALCTALEHTMED